MLNSEKKFWFVVGSQSLYGEETLIEVKKHAEIIVNGLNENENIPFEIILKDTVKTADEITKLMKEANHLDEVAGVITWMHTEYCGRFLPVVRFFLPLFAGRFTNVCGIVYQ